MDDAATAWLTLGSNSGAVTVSVSKETLDGTVSVLDSDSKGTPDGISVSDSEGAMAEAVIPVFSVMFPESKETEKVRFKYSKLLDIIINIETFRHILQKSHFPCK